MWEPNLIMEDNSQLNVRMLVFPRLEALWCLSCVDYIKPVYQIAVTSYFVNKGINLSKEHLIGVREILGWVEHLLNMWLT